MRGNKNTERKTKYEQPKGTYNFLANDVQKNERIEKSKEMEEKKQNRKRGGRRGGRSIRVVAMTKCTADESPDEQAEISAISCRAGPTMQLFWNIWRL